MIIIFFCDSALLLCFILFPTLPIQQWCHIKHWSVGLRAWDFEFWALVEIYMKWTLHIEKDSGGDPLNCQKGSHVSRVPSFWCFSALDTVLANFKGERARVPIAFNRSIPSMVMEVFGAQPRNHPTERKTRWPTELSGTTTENFNFFLSQNSSLLEKSQSCSSHVNSKWFIMVRDVHWSSAPLWILSW